MYTSHGHQIPGTPEEGPAPETRARCGGVGLCSACSKEAGRQFLKALKENEADPIDYKELLKKYIKYVGTSEGTTYLDDWHRNKGSQDAFTLFSNAEWDKLQEFDREVFPH